MKIPAVGVHSADGDPMLHRGAQAGMNASQKTNRGREEQTAFEQFKKRDQGQSKMMAPKFREGRRRLLVVLTQVGAFTLTLHALRLSAPVLEASRMCLSMTHCQHGGSARLVR